MRVQELQFRQIKAIYRERLRSRSKPTKGLKGLQISLITVGSIPNVEQVNDIKTVAKTQRILHPQRTQRRC